MGKVCDKFEIDNRETPFCQPGAVKEKDGVRFTVSVPEGERASLILYDKECKKIVLEQEFPEKPHMGNLYSMKVCGLPWKDCFYNYKIGGKIVCDPGARLLANASEEAGITCCELAFDNFDWKDDRHPDIPYNEAVMYHLHVRNFTMQPGSGVRHRGTFLGLQEKAGYLADLGINQVKLMPVCEHRLKPVLTDKYAPQSTDKKQDCWGYESGSCFAINRNYAATQNPVKEFKNMVKSFHEKGIEVILDMFFPAEMPVRTMLDCLTFWVKEYHVDGFHIFGREDAFDCLFDDPCLSCCKILVSQIPEEKNEAATKAGRFARCNDGFLVEARKLLKGDEGVLEAFAYRNRENQAGGGTIKYMVNHDGFTLMDLVSYDTKHNEENGEDNRDGARYNFSWNCGEEGPSRKKAVTALRRKQMKNAFLMMLLSQGTPMLMSGDEFGNSQNGNNNPYCLDNPVAWVDWSGRKKNRNLTLFVQKAIAFRKEHPILHMPQPMHMTDYHSFGYPDLSFHSKRAWYSGFSYEERQIGMMYCGKYAGMDEYIYVAYNLNPLSQELALPKLSGEYAWYKVIDTSLEESFPEEQEKIADVKSCIFPGRSITVLVGRRVK